MLDEMAVGSASEMKPAWARDPPSKAIPASTATAMIAWRKKRATDSSLAQAGSLIPALIEKVIEGVANSMPGKRRGWTATIFHHKLFAKMDLRLQTIAWSTARE